MRRALCLLALAGCYADGLVAGVAPVGHGHGDAAFDLELAMGYEHSDRHAAYGVGVLSGVHFAAGHTFAPIALHARGALSLSRDLDRRGVQLRPLLFGQLALGGGFGLPEGEQGSKDGPSGLFGQAFVGFGLGSPYKDPNSGATRAIMAVGPLVTWFAPSGDESAFWMIGAGFELSTGFLQEIARE